MKSYKFIKPSIRQVSCYIDASAQVGSKFCSIAEIVSDFGVKLKISRGRRKFTQEEHEKLRLISRLGKPNVSDNGILLGDSSNNNPDCDTFQNSHESSEAGICTLKKTRTVFR